MLYLAYNKVSCSVQQQSKAPRNERWVEFVEQVFSLVIAWSYEGLIQEIVILVGSSVVCKVHRCSILSLFVNLSVSTLQDIQLFSNDHFKSQ